MNPILSRPSVRRWITGLILLYVVLVPQTCFAQSHTLGALHLGVSDDDANVIVLFHFDGQETRREDLPPPDGMDLFTELVVVNGWIVYTDYYDVRAAKLGETESKRIAENVRYSEFFGDRLLYIDSSGDAPALRAFDFGTGETATIADLGRATIRGLSVSPDEKHVALVETGMRGTQRLIVVTIADGSLFEFPDGYTTGKSREEGIYPVGPIEWLDNERILTVRTGLIGGETRNIIHSSHIGTGLSEGLIDLNRVRPNEFGDGMHSPAVDLLRREDEVYVSIFQARLDPRQEVYRLDFENRTLTPFDPLKTLRGGFNIRPEEIRTESGERPEFLPDSVPAMYYNDQLLSVEWPPSPYPPIPKVCPDDHCIVWNSADLSAEDSRLSYFRPGMEEPEVLLKGIVTGFEWLQPDDVAHLQK